MPVPYPPPEKQPVVMCHIDGCCYRRHSTRQPLNFGSVEFKYTRDGYPDPR